MKFFDNLKQKIQDYNDREEERRERKLERIKHEEQLIKAKVQLEKAKSDLQKEKRKQREYRGPNSKMNGIIWNGDSIFDNENDYMR